MNAPNRPDHPIQALDSVRLSEPRIEMIHQRLQALLRVVQLESGGEPVEIDGFRLKGLENWVIPTGSPIGELWGISSACNMKCPFCYEIGDPKGGSTLNPKPAMASMREIETRLRYSDPKKGLGLFRPYTHINEMFCHPRAIDLMERIRQHMLPDEIFTFVTNGTRFTEPVVARMAKLAPIFINFSVNSLDPRIRREILFDHKPKVAIAALDLLRRYGIPYVGSLVCWPTIPWDDVEATCRALDEAGCAVIRFTLSTYSRFLDTDDNRFDRETFWAEGVALARRLQRELDTPVKVEPYHYDRPTYLPYLAGVIKGSPAWRAGLRVGDLLTHVAGRALASSNQALSAIAKARELREVIEVTYVPEGEGEPRVAVLDDGAGPFGYPYDSMQGFKGFQWGLVLIDNLKFRYFEQMREHIDQTGAKVVLLCSSEIMRPIVLEMMAATKAFEDVEVHVEVPENRFFGGNVVLGDLLVVDDYVQFIREFAAKLGEPIDQIFIPSSAFFLGGWRRDLAGVPYTEIERRVGIPVELLEIRPVVG